MKWKVLGIIIFLVFILSMQRYKEIDFKNFKTEADTYFSTDEKFFRSENLQFNEKEKGNKLGYYFEKKDMSLYMPFTPEGDTKVEYNGYIYWLVPNASEYVALYKGRRNETFTSKYVFPVLYDEERMLVMFKGTFIAFMTGGANRIYYSTDGGTTFTLNTGVPTNMLTTAIDYEIIGDDLYILTFYGLYKSKDGINFTEEINLQNILDSAYFSGKLEYLKGFLYTIIQESGKRYFVRIENNQLVKIKKINGDIQSNGENIIITESYNGNKFLKKYDGAEFSELKNFKNYTTSPSSIKPVLKGEDKIYFFLSFSGTSKYYQIFSVDKNDNVILEQILPYEDKDATYMQMERGIEHSDGTLFFFLSIEKNSAYSCKIFNNYNKKYHATGNLETNILNEGEIVPKQIILKHKPIETGTSIKVYKKSNFASSWTEILNSNTVGEIKKKYNFTNNAITDFLQFKIEMITTDDTKSPEDAELKFLYLPIGLENSK